MIITLLNIPAKAMDNSVGNAAAPVKYALSVDGKSVSLCAYEIGGSPYFKLRDIAAALSGTRKQFDVTWDQASGETTILSASAYTPVDGELSLPYVG